MTIGVISYRLEGLVQALSGHPEATSILHGVLQPPPGGEGIVQAIAGLLESYESLSNVLVHDIPLLKKATLIALQNGCIQSNLNAFRTTKGRQDPLYGKSHEYPLIATWACRCVVLQGRRLASDLVMIGLAIWRCKHPFPQQIPRPISELAGLCRKVRTNNRYSPLNDFVIDADAGFASNLIKLAAFDEFNKSEKGLRLISDALNDLQAAKVGGASPRDTPSIKPRENFPTSKERKLLTTEPDDIEQIRQNSGPDIPAPVVTRTYRQPVDPDSEINLEHSIRQPISTPEAQAFSRTGHFVRLRSARYRNALDNQFLPWSWNRLNSFEIEYLVECITSCSAETQKGALLCLLTLVTSADTQELSTATLTSVILAQAISLQLCPSAALWQRRTLDLPSRFAPSPGQRQFLSKEVNALPLPMPNLLVSLLNDWTDHTQDTGSLFSILSIASADEALTLMNEFLGACRQRNPRFRANPARLRAVVFQAVVNETGDDIPAVHAANSPEFALNVGHYYYSSGADTISIRYQQAMLSVGLPLTGSTLQHDGRVGSRLHIEPARIQGWVASAANRLNWITIGKGPWPYKRLCDAQRDMACYSLLLLQAATGHRQIKAFSLDRGSVDPAGWAMVQDKFVAESHESRLVALGNIAATQIKNYFSHLRGLAQRLRREAPALANFLNAKLPTPGENHACPLFFILPDTPKALPRPLGTADVMAWLNLPESLPANLFRHQFVTQLREHGLPGEWVSGLAGHIALGQQMFGQYSAVAPAQIWDEWQRTSDDWLTTLGFSVRVGLPVIPKTGIPGELFPTRIPNARKPSVRQLSRKQLLSALREIAPNATRENVKSDISTQEKVIEFIASNSELSATQRARINNLFVSWLNPSRTPTTLSASVGFMESNTAEPSPLSSQHLMWLERARELRCQFAAWLDKAAQNKVEIHDPMIPAVLALIIEAGMTHKAQIANVLNAGNELIQSHLENQWLEWHDGQRLIRWWPDDLTNLLLLKARSSNEYAGKRPTAEGKNRQRADFLNLLERTLREDFEISHAWNLRRTHQLGQHPCVDAVLQACQTEQRHHWPPIVATYAAGEIKPWAISRGNLLRLMTGMRECDALDSTPVDLPPPLFRNARQPDLITAKRAITDMLRAIRDAAFTDSGTKSKASRSSLREKIHLLQRSWQQAEHATLLPLLAGYAAELLHRRSNSKFYEFSTVADYVRSVAFPLLELALREDWLALDSDVIEDHLLSALNYADSKVHRPRLALRLRYFHEYCVEEYGLDPIDFGALDQAFGHRDSAVSAAWITERDFELAHSLLLQDPHATEHERESHALILTLCFRFGLRIGEVLRLTTADIVPGKPLVILIRASRWGRPKTDAGFRQLPNLFMTASEIEMLQRRITRVSHVAGPGKWPLLFGQQDDPMIRDDRYANARSVLNALKLATGNKSARTHHCRHAFASMFLLQALDGRVPWSITETSSDRLHLYRTLLGPTHPSRRIVFALSQYLGHASPSTTIQNYLHSFEFLQATLTRSRPKLNLNQQTLSYFSDLTHENIRQRSRRSTSMASFWHDLIVHIRKKARLADAASLLTDQIPDASSLPATACLSQRMPFVRMLRCLIALTEGYSIEAISMRLGVAAKALETWRLRAIALRDRCAYQWPGIEGWTAEGSPERMLPAKDAEKLGVLARYADNLHFRDRLAERLDAIAYREPAATYAAASIWMNHYRRCSAGLLILDTSDRLKFTWLIEQLGGRAVPTARASQTHMVGGVLPRNRRYPTSWMSNVGRTHSPLLSAQFHEAEADKLHSRHLAMKEFHLLLWLLLIRDGIQ